MGNTNDIDDTCAYVHDTMRAIGPWVAMLGTVLTWTGGWNFLDFITKDFTFADAYQITLEREWSLFAVGVLLLLLTNSYFSNAGVDVMIPGLHWEEWVSRSYSTTVRVLQSLLAMFASILYWVGLYNLIDSFMFTFGVKAWDYFCVMCGLNLLMVTHSLHTYGGIKVAITEVITAHTPWWRVCVLHLFATVPLFGGVMLWKGGYNTLSYHWFPASAIREWLYILIGLLLMIVNTRLARHPLVRFVPNRQKPSELRTLVTNISVMLSLVASFLLWTGMWNLLSDHVWRLCIEREITYIIVGVSMLLASGNLAAESGLNPVSLNPKELDHDDLSARSSSSNDDSSSIAEYDGLR